MIASSYLDVAYGPAAAVAGNIFGYRRRVRLVSTEARNSERIGPTAEEIGEIATCRGIKN
jgi:hypothetical protein